MWAWIAAFLAVLLWGLLIYFYGGQFRRAGREIDAGRVADELDKFFDTPEGTREQMISKPKDPVPAIKWAELARVEGNKAEYAVRVEANAKRFPMEFHSTIILAHLLWDTGHKKLSRRLMNKLARLYPSDLHVAAFRIQQAQDEGNLKLAKKIGYRIIKTKPINYHSYRLLVEVLLQLNELDAAGKVLLIADREIPENKDISELWDKLEARLQADQGVPPDVETPQA